ncbi:hypothetical protein NON20_04280 [Synechocystis sp. B12]|nr:hypothetical protein NON20_04280 [Synechocystis sp. B12]
MEDLQRQKIELLKRRADLLSEIQDINDQFREYEERGTVNHLEVSDNWFIRSRDARKHRVRELNQCEIELNDINFRQKQLTRAVDTNLSAVFFKVAEQLLPEEVFNKILAEAQSR